MQQSADVNNFTLSRKQQLCGSMLARGSAARLPVLIVASFLVLGSPLPPVAGQNSAPAETEQPPTQLAEPPGPSAPPVTLSLQDALDRARKNDSEYLAAVANSKIAHEDRLQSRNAFLPSVSDSTQYLGTQGNGKTPEGRFVTNDGVHVYREWGVINQDFSPDNYMLTTYHRARAAEALANAKAEIARRGLVVTVTKAYYALVVAQRKYATAQEALDQSKHFFDITQDQERAGQAAHADVLKAEIQYEQQRQAFEETRLTIDNARLDLAVLLFPTFNENFTVVDDLDSPRALPPFGEVESMAEHENPDLRAAGESVRAASLDVSAAKGAFLPSLNIQTIYGIEANDFALRSVAKAHPEDGDLPNLGYFITASLNIPVWDWGTLRSRLHQTEYRQQLAHATLSQTQRQVLSNLYSFYNEASVARSAVDESRHTADLAVESLRLTNLRYQSGLSTALEVVDAQNTLVFAQNSYNDSQVRYRVALANLQTLTGAF